MGSFDEEFGFKEGLILVVVFPWSELGGCDNSSAGVLIFPGMCLIMKSYSWRSACHCAVRWFSFWGAFQYWRLV